MIKLGTLLQRAAKAGSKTLEYLQALRFCCCRFSFSCCVFGSSGFGFSGFGFLILLVLHPIAQLQKPSAEAIRCRRKSSCYAGTCKLRPSALQQQAVLNENKLENIHPKPKLQR